MKLLRWLLPLLSLIAVGGVTWWDLSRSQAAPGPVHPAHAAAAGLDGGANCAACHEAGAVSADGCCRCHDAVAAQLAAGRGLHGAMSPAAARDCAACHSDHHGAALPLVPPHAFARAGVDDVASYDHAHVAFALVGAHVGLACDACHAAAFAAAPPSGGRFLGLSQRCAACHEDRHHGAFGGDCGACHAQDGGWRNLSGFEHGRFELDGAHATVGCARCHEPDSDRSVAAERSAPAAVRGCGACHDDPHGRTTLPFGDTADCARCHAAVAWASARPTLAEHGELGFALRGPHAAAACASCHGGPAAGAAAWRGDAPPRPDSCVRCHDHPHAEALVGAAVAAAPPGDGCAGCHSDADASFAVGRLSAEQHLATGFALAAPHADVACSSCHAGDDRGVRYPGRAPGDCRACHDDAHAGQFVAGDVLRQCTECHVETAFAPHRFGVAAHAARYPLTGAHDAVACALCHDRVVDGVRRFVGTERACSACHADVHDGAFDRAGRPARVDGRAGCARCHDTRGFRPVVGAFDHALWTGYELSFAHAATDCASCHRGPADGPGLGAVPGTRCADCHDDPHLGQFAVAGATDCRRCHDARSFAEVRFDHQRDSRFPLDATHRGLDCNKCHVGHDVGGRRVVRYRPLGRTCGDCHRLGERGGGPR